MKVIDDVKYELHPMSLMALVLSITSLIIVTSTLFLNKHSPTFRIFIAIDTFICLIFWCQLLIDLFRSKSKAAYLKHHWPDFIASIPAIEPLRFMRILQVLRVIRLLRSSKNIYFQLQNNRRETTLASIFLLLTVLITVGASSILFVEGNVPEANIHTAGDALWWVFVTISTVGYGDYYPVTTLGRIIAICIIICGVGLFGMVAGLISSIISDPQHEKDLLEKAHRKEWREMLANQQVLLAKLERLETKLDQLSQDKSTNTPSQH